MKLTSMLSNDDLFKGRHFDREIIILGAGISGSSSAFGF
jgi:hypothetical protein